MKPEIVFLDAGTVDYGDISFEEIKAQGRFRAYPRTDPRQLLKRVKGVPVVITNKCRFDRRVLSSVRGVASIHLAATGVNNVDLEAAKRAGIAVTNVSGYSTETVVQCTFAFLLALAGNLVAFNEASHDGRWSRSPIFTLGAFPISEVAGKTLGIIGYGAIGKRVAQVARALRMKVLAGRIPGKPYSAVEKARRLELSDLLRRSDFVTIHAPLSPLTRDLIDRDRIRKMKKGAFLINMARGGIVNEAALKEALKSGHLGGAASDVLTAEPPPRHHILLRAPHLLLTPHVAWASLEARQRVVHEIALNIEAFHGGRRRNRVV